MPNMAKPHMPTLLYAVVAIVAVVGLYHLMRRKG